MKRCARDICIKPSDEVTSLALRSPEHGAPLRLGAVAVQTGTLVKLVRVLMLGPVWLVLSLVAPRLAPQAVPKGEVVAG